MVDIEDWNPYLCFVCDRIGRSIMSPQGTATFSFANTFAWDWSESRDDRTRFRENFLNVVDNGVPCSPFTWSARYDASTVRSYIVWIDPVIRGEYFMVRLYRDERDKYGITHTEKTILGMIARDWSDAKIAEKLDISRSTVRVHVQNAKHKIGVDGRVRLGIEAYRLGLITLPTRKDHVT